MKKQKRNLQPLYRLLFTAYSLFMLWLLFIRGRDSHLEGPYLTQLHASINYIPFHTIGNYLYVLRHSSNGDLIRHCFINLAGNVLLFIPAGWLLPRIFRKLHSFWRFLLCCILSISAVELLQLVTLRGSLDVDDLILNLSGMLLGFILYHITKKK